MVANCHPRITRVHVRLALLLVGVLLVTLRPTSVRAATITVNTLTDAPTSQCSLRQAVLAVTTQQAQGGCPAGTGNDTIQFSVTGTITLAQADGPIRVSNNVSLTIDGPGSDSLAIDGGQLGQFFLDSGVQLTLEGLTFQNAGAGNGDNGGAIDNAGSLTISNSTFQGNVASSGGAIDNTGSLTISNSTFTNNQACCAGGSSGGAILSQGGSLILSNSTFTNNQAPSNGVRNNDGGAIYSDKSSLSITGSAFTNNSAQDNGGAIYHYNAQFTLAGSTFTGNTSSNDNGGALYNYDATTTITTTTFSGNTAVDHSGGGIYNYHGTLSVTASTLSGNVGDSYGGGLYNDGGSVTVINSTFSDNAAGVDGSAIAHDGQSLSIQSSTIANPQRTRSLRLYSGGASLLNSVLAASPLANCGGSISDQGGNVADDNSCNFTQSSSKPSVNPLLGPLQDNGGPTQTMALQPGSPAIGAAVNCPPPTTDQRGQPRTAPCDSGAHQTQGTGAALRTPTPTATLPPSPAPLLQPMTLTGQAWRVIPPLVSEGVVTHEVVPVVRRMVEALVGATVCGQALTDRQGRFQLTVAHAARTPGCGRPGAAVTFRVHGEMAASDPLAFQSGGQAAVTLILPGPQPPQRR